MIHIFSFGQATEWPVLKHYDEHHLDKIALPVGGIGTGTISLGGRGNLQDWEIMNRPAKGYNPGPGIQRTAPFFAVYVNKGDKKITKILEGPMPLFAYEGSSGAVATNHGWPRFRHASFDAAYPFGQVHLWDSTVPVRVTIRAFNPMIPGDPDNSGIPLAVFRVVLQNVSGDNLDASVCYSMQNFIGEDGHGGLAIGNRNEFREENRLKGIFMSSSGVNPGAEQWGTMAVTTTADHVSYRTHWKPWRWGTSLLDFWDDFSRDGRLEERPGMLDKKPMASLAASVTIPAGETRTLDFYLTWDFPNRKAWSDSMLLNYYSEHYTDAWDVIRKVLPELPDLEKKTVLFVQTFCNSDLPEAVKEAALFNTSTLRTQTCFRISNGNFYAWEGCNDRSGCCMGSCTHVWNYEQATGFLYGSLARNRRYIEFGLATENNGMMNFRVKLPPHESKRFGHAAADGQMGAIIKMYRDWQLSGDDDFMKSLYPQVKKALYFAWLPGSWDANRDGVMEGVQHNTMDVEYFGPNPQMEIWYLGALRAVEEMARYVGDKHFADTCHTLFVLGSTWTDKNLFNGEYYIHKVQVPADSGEIEPGLIVGMGSRKISHPEYQLGEGCLVDQLVGQYAAHVSGLGYLVQPAHVKTTLHSIMKYNYRNSGFDRFNCFRCYTAGNEAGLVMASYPYGRPENPFPYFTEMMTGFEYTAAVGMLFEQQTDNGLKNIRNIRNRYDGEKRSPFDEAECGHHYGRAMASWSAVLALTGFHYSGVTKEMTFTSRNGKYFWSDGEAWGEILISSGKTGKNVTIHVMHGTLQLKKLILVGYGEKSFHMKTSGQNAFLSINIRPNNPKAGIPVYLYHK
ncbi:MAG: hypothetical protein J7K46_00305 [Bacteroidales bacterium]|nr:hypothetical protein [Bacteroidales bacterium]